MRVNKFAACPTRAQRTLLRSHSKILNRLYNYFLGLELVSIEAGKGTITRFELDRLITDIKANETFPGLKDIHSQVVQQVSKRVHASVKMWKMGYVRKPQYRSHRIFFSLCYPQNGYSIMSHVLHTKIYGDIKIRDHRSIKGNVKQVSINCKNGKWFVYITTDHDPTQSRTIAVNSDVGIDVGITNLITTSDGVVVKPRKDTKYLDTIINRLKACRDQPDKQKGSRQHQRLSEVIQRLYDVKGRRLNDQLHKVSHHLSSAYDAVYFEDLNVKKLGEGKATGLNRELRNVGLGRLLQMITYKTNYPVPVNPHNTTKACYACGKLHSMPLSKRVMKCECGVTIDRDLNAALNVLHLGRSVLMNLAKANATVETLRWNLSMVMDDKLLLARDGPVLRTAQA